MQTYEGKIQFWGNSCKWQDLWNSLLQTFTFKWTNSHLKPNRCSQSNGTLLYTTLHVKLIRKHWHAPDLSHVCVNIVAEGWYSVAAKGSPWDDPYMGNGTHTTTVIHLPWGKRGEKHTTVHRVLWYPLSVLTVNIVCYLKVGQNCYGQMEDG